MKHLLAFLILATCALAQNTSVMVDKTTLKLTAPTIFPSTVFDEQKFQLANHLGATNHNNSWTGENAWSGMSNFTGGFLINHEAFIFSHAANHSALTVSGTAGQTEDIFIVQDNSDAERISVDANINLNLHGHNLLNPGNVPLLGSANTFSELQTFSKGIAAFPATIADAAGIFTARLGQTGDVFVIQDNSDADSIRVDKDINLNLNGNKIYGVGNGGIAFSGTGALDTRTNLLPDQTSHSGEVLTTNGTVVSWGSVSGIPSMTGNSGKVLTNNGTTANWAAVSTLLGANLQAFDALSGAADKMQYFTGAGTLALTNLTGVARTFLATGTVQLQRDALVVPGLATDNAFTGSQSFTLPLLTGSFAVHPGDPSSIFLVDTKQIDLLAGASGSVNVLADGIIFDGAMSFTGGTLDMGPALFSSGTVMTLTGGVFISGGSTLEDDYDVSAASFSGTMQLNDALDVSGVATFRHEALFYTSAIGATPMQVTAAAGQTAAVARWNDNSDADAILIDKDINLQMGGNNIAGAGNVAASSFTGALTGNVTGNVTGNAGTATALATGRTFSGTGDAEWTSAAFNGTADETAAVTVKKINGVSFAGLATGLLKNTTTTGAPVIAAEGTDYYKPGGTKIAVADGGTNIASYAVGDLLYASGATTLSKLADVATGSVLISGGVTTAPAWSTTPTFTATNVTGLPIAGITGLGTGVGTFFATPSSANLAAAITNETGSNALVFQTGPTFDTFINLSGANGAGRIVFATQGSAPSTPSSGTRSFYPNNTGIWSSVNSSGAVTNYAELQTAQTWTAAQTFNTAARTSGVLPYLKFTIPTDTGQTAATESPGILGVTGTRTWATTGTVALQREIFFPGPTYASASASQTFTDVFNLYLTPPVQGTNAIFTRNHSFGIVDSTSASSSITGGFVIAATLGTAATSVGIGGGNVNAGGTITSGGAASVGGKISSYNGVTTAGWGVPAIQNAGRTTAQTAANASVATYTVGAADGTFLVSANVLVTTSAVHSFTMTCAYTDEGNTARTVTLNFAQLAGTIGTSIANAAGAVPYEGLPIHIRCKASTAITLATTGTFTSVTYNAEGIIQQVN